MNVKQYLASIGSKGGKAGTGKSKARTRKQAQAAARMRWANELAKKQTHGMKHTARMPNDTLCRPAVDAGGAQDNQSKSL